MIPNSSIAGVGDKDIGLYTSNVVAEPRLSFELLTPAATSDGGSSGGTAFTFVCGREEEDLTGFNLFGLSAIGACCRSEVAETGSTVTDLRIGLGVGETGGDELADKSGFHRSSTEVRLPLAFVECSESPSRVGELSNCLLTLTMLCTNPRP